MTNNVVSLSGGKDSTAMLLMMLEREMKVDRVIFVDTTKEFPQMYSHLDKLDLFIEPYGLTIERVSFDYDYWFCRHIKTRGKRKGEKGYGWPDFSNRWCTTMKRNAFIKNTYVDGRDVIEYHGIAYDEKHRAARNYGWRNIRYPLIEWKVTEKDALEYCYSKGFDWGGLYEEFDRVSCWCCPLSRINELRTLFWNYPELWEQLKEMDKMSKRRFRKECSVMDLERRFIEEGVEL